MAEIRKAASISVSRCPHGTLHVHLHDDDGTEFAAASMGSAVAMQFFEQVGDALQEILTEQDRQPDVDGEAVH